MTIVNLIKEREDDGFKEYRTTIELLREENLKKDAQIEKMRKENTLAVTELEERVKELVHQKQMIEMKSASEIKNAEQKFKALQDKTNIELGAIKSKQQEIEARNPLLRERLAEAKEELKDLAVSEARYLELKVTTDFPFFGNV